ncbi:MAG: ArsR family transcriptional regulator, arsenate/arsenite/antimonite-responsive transcriptional repressor [Thiomicrorhabdus sp.]|nr:MAG: ArsR family transcriptional regulator, arsenate/arsenite/antimonite-responsive transcriptional repressor [Thiomicrorhabdus sp.]
MTNLDDLKALEEHAQFHKAFAEPVRLRILALLRTRESLCVCDLVSVLELSQSTVSRHLAYLKNQGIVNSWREGTWIHYSLDKNHPASEVLLPSLAFLGTLEQAKNDCLALKRYEKSPRQCKAN